LKDISAHGSSPATVTKCHRGKENDANARWKRSNKNLNHSRGQVLEVPYRRGYNCCLDDTDENENSSKRKRYNNNNPNHDSHVQSKRRGVDNDHHKKRQCVRNITNHIKNASPAVMETEEEDVLVICHEETCLIGKARALLRGPIRALLEKNGHNRRDIVEALNDVFSGPEQDAEDLLHALCDVLVVDYKMEIDYNNRSLTLFYDAIDSIDDEGPCVVQHFKRQTHKLLSLIYNYFNEQWVKQEIDSSPKSLRYKEVFRQMTESMPNSSREDIVKAVYNVIKTEDEIYAEGENNAADNDQSATEEHIGSVGDVPLAMKILLRHQYKNCYLWCEHDLGEFMYATTIVVGSFAVCSAYGDYIIPKNAHKDGFWKPAFAMRMYLSMFPKHSGTICVDLFPGAHEASAFDNGVPPELVGPGALHAKAILKLRMKRIIALGAHVNDALVLAAKTGYPIANIEHLPHPTCMSIFLCGPSTAQLAAALYDKIFGTSAQTGSYVGRLFMDSLFGSNYGGKKGPLFAIIFKRYLEKISNTPRHIVHHLVAALCTELGINSDEDAATYLRENGYDIDPLLQTRTGMYLRVAGRRGGNRGTLKDHVVLAAKSNLTAAIEGGCDASTIAKLKLELEKAQEECDAIAQRRRIGYLLGCNGVKLVEDALALGDKSLANATEQELNAVIESFDSQLYQTHRLRSLMSRIGNALGAGGGVLVEKALALYNKSLADVSDGDLDVIIKSLQSVAKGKKEYKTMSAEEERQLNEKISLRHHQSLKDYDKCVGNKFLEGAGEWRHRKEGEWSVEEIKIIMAVEGDWNKKNMYRTLARRLEGRGTSQVSQWIRDHKRRRLA
jgi:DNA-binding NarL/FixJ family response regulator